MTNVSPGWYPDPSGAPQSRWWDGSNWGQATQAAIQPYDHQQQFAQTVDVNTTTPVIWPIALWPLIGVLSTILYGAMGGYATTTVSSSPFNVYTTADIVNYSISFVSWLGFALLGFLDNRELKARQLPQPFAWGWAFLPVVYIIGRSVVVYRRTRKGLAPLFVWIGTIVLTWIVSFAVAIVIGIAQANELGLLDR